MKKKFYLPLMACLLLIGATGCSSDSDVNEPARQDLTVTYYLTNEAGEVKTTFSYGEEIFFHLTVGNNTDATVTFSSLEDLYGSEWTLEKEDEIVNAIKNSLFAVYTAQGQFVGNPWTLIDSKECVSIKPQQSVEIAIPWQKYSRRTIQLARKYSSAIMPHFRKALTTRSTRCTGRTQRQRRTRLSSRCNKMTPTLEKINKPN